MKAELRKLNRRFAPKGLRFLPLRIEKNYALIYVYRPERLKADLSYKEASGILNRYGYGTTESRCVAHLIGRLRENGDFPHEIGLFLSYPPEDVKGFIEQAKPKFSGYWKVYGDENSAREIFERYKRCTESYLHQLNNGSSLDRLVV